MRTKDVVKAAALVLLVLIVTLVGGGIEPPTYQGPFAWPW